jgi:hypothetical protein
MLDDNKIEPLPTYTNDQEVDDDDYNAEEDTPIGVRNSATVTHGDEKVSENDVWKLLGECQQHHERHHADNVETPKPVHQTFAEAVERAPDNKSCAGAPRGVPKNSTDGSPWGTMTATHHHSHESGVRESQRKRRRSAMWSFKLC